MSERARSLASQVRDAGAALIETIGQIDDSHWARVPEPGVWSAGKDAEHLTQGAVYHQWLVRTAALGETVARGAGTQRDVMTAQLSRAEVLAALAQRTEESARLVESLSDAQLDRPAPPLGDGPPRTVAQMIEGQMIHHYGEHQLSIETKLRSA
jgi:hypothetical protein